MTKNNEQSQPRINFPNLQASLYDRDNYIERKLKINYKTQFPTNMMLKDEKKKQPEKMT
jgi:hypothetical protein